MKIMFMVLISISLFGACTDNDNKNPAEMCDDLVSAYCEAFSPCDLDNSYSDCIALIDCDEVDSIRDVDELYHQCIPYLDNATCYDYEYGIDDSCVSQLQYD